MGIAITPNGNTAYVVLDNNDTLTSINLTVPNPTEGPEIRVGNVPHSVVISPDGTTAYVSNEGGRIARATDFQGYSNGTPVVASNPTGATASGTISVVNLSSFSVTKNIVVGLHPTGMAFWGQDLLVANAYSDSISVINTATNTVTQTINLDPGLGIKVPGGAEVGVGPNSIAVDSVNNIAYVALYNANAVAVVDLSTYTVSGLIPIGYAPSSVVLDAADGELLVANDKGLGTTGYRCVAASDEYIRKLVRNLIRRDRLEHPPGPRHREHHFRSRCERNPDGDDDAGHPEQPLGSRGKYRLRLRWQQQDPAGRDPG